MCRKPGRECGAARVPVFSLPVDTSEGDAMDGPTINDAKAVALKYRKRGVIILSFSGEGFAVTSYGMTRADCDAMRQVNDQIADMLAAGDIALPDGFGAR